MTLLEHYKKLCSKESFTPDAEQQAVVNMMQTIFNSLLKEHTKRSGLTKRIRKKKTVSGLYLWGGVGVGKTMLLDCFYQALPFDKKLRIHFYQFMQLLHDELRNLQGRENPLQEIAKNIADKTLVICFDEFIVTDIVDALVLKNLLCELFSQGVCIVSTSNVIPDNLCKKAWRDNFSPAVAAIKKHMTIMQIASNIDYRKKGLTYDHVCYNYHDATAKQHMETAFSSLTTGKEISEEAIEILSRKIAVRKRSPDVIWFDFSALCSIPRSQQDYLAIAKKYKIIFISNIPVFSALADNSITLFIRLIDVLYDTKVQLIFSSAGPIEQLYAQGKMSFEFARTCSRLIEMQASHQKISPGYYK